MAYERRVGWLRRSQEGLQGYANNLKRVKAQIEFNLGTAIKDNKNVTLIRFTTKRGAQDNLHSLWNGGGNVADEKAEVFHAFFALIFHTKTSCHQGTQHYEL